MGTITNYGRNIVKVKKGKLTIYVLSGQWVGHRDYGIDGGTERQRNLLLKACGGDKIIAVSETIFWNIKGSSGDIIDKTSDLVKKAKF
jgi:hypothetical protein